MQTVLEIEIVDVNSVQFVHHDELVDAVELHDQLTAEQWLDGDHQSVRCGTH